MSAKRNTPSYRSLDIYRLHVVRQLKQCQIAESFHITPARVCQVVRCVHDWVDQTIGDWLFPGRDDLRFYVAFESEQIRVQESDADPELVVLVGPGWSYSRHDRVESELDWQPEPTAKPDAFLSAKPINPALAATGGGSDVNPSGQSDLADPLVTDLACRIAQLLIVWKKSRKFSAAIKAI